MNDHTKDLKDCKAVLADKTLKKVAIDLTKAQDSR